MFTDAVATWTALMLLRPIDPKLFRHPVHAGARGEPAGDLLPHSRWAGLAFQSSHQRPSPVPSILLYWRRWAPFPDSCLAKGARDGLAAGTALGFFPRSYFIKLNLALGSVSRRLPPSSQSVNSPTSSLSFPVATRAEVLDRYLINRSTMYQTRGTKWPTSEGRCHFARCVSEDDRREIAVRAAHGAVPQENRGQPAVSKGQPWFSFASFVSTLTNSARSKTKGLLCVFGSSSQRGRTALPDSGGTFLRKAVSDFQSMNQICYRCNGSLSASWSRVNESEAPLLHGAFSLMPICLVRSRPVAS
jgi:hypothetical protein